MDYKEITEQCKTDGGLVIILNNYNDAFLQIDQCASLVQGGVLDNPQECIKILSELTGYFMSLNSVVVIVGSEKAKQELQEYHRLRAEYEDEKVLTAKGTPKKFTDASCTKESSMFVSEIRRVRNIFDSYVHMCDKGIGSCQSILKYLGREHNIPQD